VAAVGADGLHGPRAKGRLGIVLHDDGARWLLALLLLLLVINSRRGWRSVRISNRTTSVRSLGIRAKGFLIGRRCVVGRGCLLLAGHVGLSGVSLSEKGHGFKTCGLVDGEKLTEH
jgi:hypothetical protein